MYSVKLVDCGVGDLKMLGFADIEYDDEGRVKKVENIDKIIQQVKVIMMYPKTKKNWWDPDYGGDRLVLGEKKNLPAFFVLPLQVSLSDTLSYLVKLHTNSRYKPEERLVGFDVYTYFTENLDAIYVEIKIISGAAAERVVKMA